MNRTGMLRGVARQRRVVAELQVGRDDIFLSAWYRALLAPSVKAGLVTPADLAGYRGGPIYIRRSMHVPPPQEAVRDLMPAFFECLREEEDPAVRVVLGHFVFVYIHPYMDGNGRIGRFLMNLMLAAGGYPWTVIPVQSVRRGRRINKSGGQAPFQSSPCLLPRSCLTACSSSSAAVSASVA